MDPQHTTWITRISRAMDSHPCWLVIVVLAVSATEFGLRLNALQPRLTTCPWREWPRLLWRTMLDDRIYLMDVLSPRRSSIAEPRDKDITRRASPGQRPPTEVGGLKGDRQAHVDQG